MTYQVKSALIIGFSLCLLVAVVVADHFSAARHAQLESSRGDAVRIAAPPTVEPLAAATPKSSPGPSASERKAASLPTAPIAPLPEPVVIANGPTASSIGGSTSSGGTLSDLLESGAGVRPLMSSEPRVFAPPSGRGAEVVRAEPQRAEPVGGVRTLDASGTRGFVSYTVKPGDTLYRIAQRVLGNGERWRELQAMNSGTVPADGSLYVGMSLKLPASASGRDAQPEKRPTPRRRESPRGSDRRYYVVKPGDTLGLIAQRELGTVRRQGELLRVNASRIRDEDEIYVGMKLELPS